MSDQNKDYSWLTDILYEHRIAVADIIELAIDSGVASLDKKRMMVQVLDADEKSKAAIIAKIDHHYIGKGEAERLKGENKTLRHVINYYLGDDYMAEHPDPKEWRAEANRRSLEDAEEDERYVEQRCIEARLDELEEAFVRNLPSFADEIDIERHWNDYYEVRHKQLSTNNKDVENE